MIKIDKITISLITDIVDFICKDEFWNSVTPSLGSLRKRSANKHMKYVNILRAMHKDEQYSKECIEELNERAKPIKVFLNSELGLDDVSLANSIYEIWKDLPGRSNSEWFVLPDESKRGIKSSKYFFGNLESFYTSYFNYIVERFENKYITVNSIKPITGGLWKKFHQEFSVKAGFDILTGNPK
jgi:hypothetical protein